jgi:hypothetical protein
MEVAAWKRRARVEASDEDAFSHGYALMIRLAFLFMNLSAGAPPWRRRPIRNSTSSGYGYERRK